MAAIDEFEMAKRNEIVNYISFEFCGNKVSAWFMNYM